jgi:hypothetical protein
MKFSAIGRFYFQADILSDEFHLLPVSTETSQYCPWDSDLFAGACSAFQVVILPLSG